MLIMMQVDITLSKY